MSHLNMKNQHGISQSKYIHNLKLENNFGCKIFHNSVRWILLKIICSGFVEAMDQPGHLTKFIG